jgi:imipenem/basic amino acid-specific outer membrane pore
MKLGKLSLVAVMALGTSAFAIENVKVNGEAKLIYQTADFEKYAGETFETGMFKQGNLGQAPGGASYGGAAAGGASLTVGMTADLTKEVSAGAEMQAFSTLGLENNLVSNTMIGTAGNVGLEDSWAMSQVWLASTMGKTTVKIGRQELDTPLLFTEKWNLLKNTFDAAVILNNDLPDTTLVGAWVGKHNGQGQTAANFGGNGRTAAVYGAAQGDSAYGDAGLAAVGAVNMKGAYAVAAVNKSIPNTTLQAWYYNIVSAADALWLQADAKVMGMVSVGAQYSQINPKSTLAAVPDSKIWALKAGADVAGVNVYAAYSQADEDGFAGFSNVSTSDKTKIYTGDGSIYMDGIVTAPGTKAYKIGASTKMVPGVALAASYASASDVNVDNADISAWDVSASGSAGPVGLTAIYTQVDNDSTQYGGRDNDTLRIIASLKF